MIDTSDFYVNLAAVAGTLLGTFVIGAFFYLDSQSHRRAAADAADDLYLRAGMRWVLVAYSLPVFASLTLASLPPIYGAVVFAALSVMLLLSTISTVRRMLTAGRAAISTALASNEWMTAALVPVIVVLPWIVGGAVVPPSDAYVISLILATAIAFSSTAALVMAQFDSSMGDWREAPMPQQSQAPKTPQKARGRSARKRKAPES